MREYGLTILTFGTEKGISALGIAACACPQQYVYETISVLLESGADPNSRMYGSGGTPLMAAVLDQSLMGVRALLACDRLDLEIGLGANNATALNIAGISGTYAIIEALLNAGADRFHRCTCETCVCNDFFFLLLSLLLFALFLLCCCKHRNDNGGSLLTDMALNPISDPSWFELVCNSGSSHDHGIESCLDFINAIRTPRKWKWKVIEITMRTIFRLGISRSSLVMNLAHDNGGVLHYHAQPEKET